MIARNYSSATAHRRLVAAIGLALASLLWAGCRAREAPAPPVPFVDRPQLDRLIEEHRGRVVLVDFWATWCDPCKRLFPHTVELARRYADRGLSVVTVSLDSPRNVAAVGGFLADHGATATENFLARHGAGSESVSEFEITGGGIPFLKIYDRKGRLQATLTGPSPDAIDREVRKLLDEK